MVALDKFREFFRGHQDKYVIIGGTACEAFFGQRNLSFRVTKDIDMVLCVDKVDADFAERFKAFLDAGGYKARERSDKRKEFYRFQEPSNPDFPFQIELFARNPEAEPLPPGTKYTRVEVDGDIVSLSGILLNEAYFQLLLQGRNEIGEITFLDPERLVVFKAFAHIQHVALGTQGGDARKHRNDVYRLLAAMDPDVTVNIPAEIQNDIRQFISIIEADSAFNPRDLKLQITKERGIERLTEIFSL